MRTGKIEKPMNCRKDKKDSHIMILGHMIRRMSTVSEYEEEEEEEEKDRERKSVHQERLRKLLTSEVAEMNDFDNKRLSQGT